LVQPRQEKKNDAGLGGPASLLGSVEGGKPLFVPSQVREAGGVTVLATYLTLALHEAKRTPAEAGSQPQAMFR
jgi:hypothetical protein